LAAIAETPPDEIVYVDETGIDTYLNREYGWSERGEPIMGFVSGRKFKRVGIVAAQKGKTILSPLQYDGTMDSTLFEIWFTSQLLPSLPINTVIVMDNASFHRKNKLFGFAEEAGQRLIFLPPYSPELNPIENFWAWLKRYLRKSILSHVCFDDAVCSAFTVG
jgi:transposase